MLASNSLADDATSERGSAPATAPALAIGWRDSSNRKSATAPAPSGFESIMGVVVPISEPGVSASDPTQAACPEGTFPCAAVSTTDRYPLAMRCSGYTRDHVNIPGSSPIDGVKVPSEEVPGASVGPGPSEIPALPGSNTGTVAPGAVDFSPSSEGDLRCFAWDAVAMEPFAVAPRSTIARPDSLCCFA